MMTVCTHTLGYDPGNDGRLEAEYALRPVANTKPVPTAPASFETVFWELTTGARQSGSSTNGSERMGFSAERE